MILASTCVYHVIRSLSTLRLRIGGRGSESRATLLRTHLEFQQVPYPFHDARVTFFECKKRL